MDKSALLYQFHAKAMDPFIKLALKEDIGRGDITSLLTIPKNTQARFQIRAREPMILCGAPIAVNVFRHLSKKLSLHVPFPEGTKLKAGDVLLEGQGNVHVILAGERVALNLLRISCGVATITHRFVEEIASTKAQILDTRKTIPNLRILQKYAVTVGGGKNHRFGLDDAILIKDNHISAAGSLTEAVKRAKFSRKRPASMKIEVECDTLGQVQEALAIGVDIILLDNMDKATLTKAVSLVKGQIPLEASGNVNLDTVLGIAKTGVDFISVGMITHSTPNVDIGLDI